ncbi:MAG: cell division protein FtsL [Schwartzia sp.]|nr:cell division protein FtsL [Schwartzia sp. (in: firmicutes)]
MPAVRAREEEFHYERDLYTAPAREPVHRVQPAERPCINTSLRNRALVLAMVLTVAASVITARSILSAVRGTEMVQTRRAAEQLESENLQLELEIARLKSPQHIKDIAINHLGMVVPRDVYFAAEKQ